MSDDVLDRAQQTLNGGIDCAETSLIRDLVDALRAEKADAEELHTWEGLMYLLHRYYPEDIFPTQPDDADRDPGPRIVSLVRYLNAARTENEQLREEADRWQSMWRQDLENADTAMRERDKANTENERLQEGLAAMRSSLTSMRHSTMCATFIDGAPEPDCTCDRGAVLAWIDHIQKGTQR